ncbi:hypothetical protein [Actinomadura litoris]|uniref:hypothetical protein n=1 Tax=Actinomadura litoris TaxID=2678616 RepID=UPI001FA75053|nr:hypothetical protein [Actinomadura litoris]
MLEELNYLRTHGSVLDPDVVSMLHDAATTLRPHVNEDTVSGLWDAADVFQKQSLYDVATALRGVVSELPNIPDLVVQLEGIVRQLQRLQGYM